MVDNSKIRLPRVQVRLKQRRGLTHRKEMAPFDNSHRRSKQQFDNNSQDLDVIYRHSGISGENSPNGQVAYEALPMVPENPLEVSPVIGQKDTMFRDFEKTTDMVEKFLKNVLIGCPLHAEEHNLLLFTDASVKGWGAHLGDMTVSGLWSDTEANLHINVLELKAVVLAIRSFQTHLMNKRVLVASDIATVVSYLNKQGGTHFLEMCLMIWCLMAFCNPRGSAHPRLSECDSRQPFSQGQDYSNRMVSSSQDFSGDLLNLAQANDRYVCNQNEQQTTSLGISSPRSKCNGSRCIEYLVGGTRR